MSTSPQAKILGTETSILPVAAVLWCRILQLASPLLNCSSLPLRCQVIDESLHKATGFRKPAQVMDLQAHEVFPSKN